MNKKPLSLGLCLLGLVSLSSCGAAGDSKEDVPSEEPSSSADASSALPETSSESSSESSSIEIDPLDDDPISLAKDPAKDYEYAPSSNENGSMHYEIFVRSFFDSNGDGIGDLNGVKAKLPYLADMGYKSIWLMPIFPSPSYHGYDVTDYFSVNKDYGTLEDFDSLVEEAKKHNIDIMLDMVLNHCSIQNPYFTEAFADYKAGKTGEDSKADWFNFGPGGDHIYQGVYYESRFNANMPDFNLDCEAVREEIEKIVKFWIDRGVKGFRLDAVLYYYYMNVDKNVAFLNWLSDTVHKYDPDFYLVGEAWTEDAALNSYFASKCDSFFAFSEASGGMNSCVNFIKGYGNAAKLSQAIQSAENNRKKKNSNSYTSYFLSNHDQDRIAKNFTVDATYKSACTYYALLPGTSYTYYGEEIALKGARGTNPDDQNDVKRRLPMIWSQNDKTGECSFPDKTRLDLDTTQQVSKGVEDQLNEPFSLTKHYKMMIHLRNKYSWIKRATYKDLTSSLSSDEKSLMAYSLSYGEERIVVVHNFASHNVEVSSPASSIIDQINIAHRIPELQGGKLRLAAHSSVIMK